MAEQPALSFAGLLRQARGEARLTQEELAEAARLSPRSVSDLERGVNRTARKDTVLLLADALSLAGPVRVLFVAAARGRAPAGEVLAARAGAAAATRTLPRDVASFTGRQAELAQLLGALAGVAASGGVVGIHAIDGMAGIGKTTFAVHAAHRLAGDFPDGQFFLPLHAHTPGQRPVDPADALASLLLTAGAGAQQIPPGLEARAGLWRDYLAGKKVLLLLDDAAGHEQVRPLLPGTAGSLVLVTSRRRLAALEVAQAISLDTLPPGEAAALLATWTASTISTCSPSPLAAATACTTCSTNTPASWQPPVTRRTATPPSAGCWIIICTLPWPPAGTSPSGAPPTTLSRPGPAGLRPVEHPGFGGDSILPRCSGLGGRRLPRYRRLAEPRSDHFSAFVLSNICPAALSSCPAWWRAPPARPPAGGWASPRRAPAVCAAGSPGWARVTRSVIACDAGGALDLGGGSVAPVPRPARRCPPAAAPVLTCRAISEEGRGPGRSPGGCGRSPPG